MRFASGCCPVARPVSPPRISLLLMIKHAYLLAHCAACCLLPRQYLLKCHLPDTARQSINDTVLVLLRNIRSWIVGSACYRMMTCQFRHRFRRCKRQQRRFHQVEIFERYCVGLLFSSGLAAIRYLRWKLHRRLSLSLYENPVSAAPCSCCPSIATHSHPGARHADAFPERLRPSRQGK